MQLMSRMIVLTAAGLLALSGVAIADDSVDEQLQQLNDRMEQLEGQLDDANAKVEAQDEVIREASLDEARPGSNGLSAFIESTEISAWVAASYNINFRNPDKTPVSTPPPTPPDGSTGTTNAGGRSGVTHFATYPESNTFQVDQAWIGINKAPTEESRAGFNLDLVAGQANNGAAGGYGLGVYAGSASYMMPLMEGFTIEGGLLPTAQGAEVLQVTQNLNLSRGINWHTQPVTNLGATGTLAVSDSLSVMVGILNNSWSLDGPQDSNNNKAITSRVNFSADKFAIGAGVNWTKNESGMAAGDHLLFNAVASVDPTDTLTAYIDYTMNIFDLGGADMTSHGVAIATRLEVLDTTGIALRGEVILDEDDLYGTGGTLYTVTGTIDHALTDNLTANVEIRWDGSEVPVFWNSSGTTLSEDSQVMGIFQLVYEF